jgi:hypothetical protein
MIVYLKFKNSKIYKKAASVLTVIEKNDNDNSIIIDACDRWSAGQIIMPISNSLVTYKIYE